MRAAPAVDVALDAGRLGRMLIVLLHAGTGIALASWGMLHAEIGIGPAALTGVGALALLMAGLGFALARRALPVAAGRLRWDGQIWCWQGAVEPDRQPLARLEVSLDLGHWALLRLHPGAGRPPLWRVASARAAGTSWHGLRVALAAHAGAAAVLRTQHQTPGPREPGA